MKVKKFDEYCNEGLLNFDQSIIKKAYRKAIEHIKKAKENLTEDHVIDFIIHFVFNNYGIDLTHSKVIYKHMKTYVHHKLKGKE